MIDNEIRRHEFPCWRINIYTLFVLIIFVFYGCGEVPKNNVPPMTQSEVKNNLIHSHVEYVKQETDEINQYVSQHKYDMITTPTGIHYMIYQHGTGKQAKEGEFATISYVVSLLDGKVCYDS